MNAEAITAAIAHEIRQPLFAIILEGSADVSAYSLKRNQPRGCGQVCRNACCYTASGTKIRFAASDPTATGRRCSDRYLFESETSDCALCTRTFADE
jgi:signal transduction histidine kinase